jgi:aminoglycoside 6'-N-acetyltransferase I
VRIIDLTPDNEPALQQAAELLVDLLPNGWPTIESALKEVRECVEPGKIARVAVDGDTLLGWVGGQVMQAYEGNVWELHPIVVRRDRQRRGIGRALIEDLEGLVRAQGALTLYLGADDDRDQTSLSGVDLYPNVLEHAQRIENLRSHQYEFYERCGYVIVGLMPDANGFGKPDIYMAKRIVPLAR